VVPDLVAVGWVTLDRLGGELRPGGAAYFAAVTAARQGLRVGVLTSHGPDFPLAVLPPGVEVVDVGAARTAVIRVEPGRGGRQLALEAAASPIGAAALPVAWRGAPLAVVGPIAGEVDPELAGSFRDASVAVLPQGWMRRLDPAGRLAPGPWEHAGLVLPHTQLLAVSAEDIASCEAQAREWFQQVPLAVVTRGRDGALLFVNGERYHVEADPAREVDDTGAGDVFATTLLVHYQREGNPWEAAGAAACAAAASVEGKGADTIPDRAALEARLAAYRRRRDG
ncbi:MAG TPA: PfkB family carbohydrate kinase, partial [Vicinamibacteria bacterium]